MRLLAAVVGAGLVLLSAACGSERSPATTSSGSTAVAIASRTAEPSASPTAARPLDISSPQFALFRQFADAVNRGDAPGALKFFTEDVVWERGGQCPPTMCKGIQTVQRELTRDVGAHHQVTLLSGEIVPGGQRIRAEIRTDGTRRGGVERIIQFFSLELRGEQIAAVRVSFDVSDAVTAAFVASQAGQQQNR